MSEIGQSIKSIVKKGIEMIGNSAESLASTTRQKVEAYNLSNEQKEVFALIGTLPQSDYCSYLKQITEYIIEREK